MADKSILEQLLEEAAEHGRKSAQAGDFAVNLTTTDADGTHSIEGIPISKVGKKFLARFGLETGDSEGGDGAGDSGQAGGEGGAGKPPTALKDYFGGGKRAAGGAGK